MRTQLQKLSFLMNPSCVSRDSQQERASRYWRQARPFLRVAPNPIRDLRLRRDGRGDRRVVDVHKLKKGARRLPPITQANHPALAPASGEKKKFEDDFPRASIPARTRFSRGLSHGEP